MPGTRGIVLIVIASIIVGVGAGWFTTTMVRLMATPEPSPSSSLDPSPSATTDPIIPMDLYPPITRIIDADDWVAGLNVLDIETVGSGSFVSVPGDDQPEGEGPVHWVNIEIEDGLPLNPDALSIFVMTTLNDPKGWGANDRMTFARTDGAAEIYIDFASPETAKTHCPRPHEAVIPDVAPPVTTPDPSPEVSLDGSSIPTPSTSPSPEPELSCAERGIVVVNAYQWADGLKAFGEDRRAARVYLLNHFLGHILGKPDVTCSTSGEQASVMVDHEFDITPCLPNGWPYPIST